MRIYNQGAHVRVTVSRSEVYDFKRRWPCSGLPDRAITFVFDARNGDLVDLYPYGVDGDDARALCDRAQQYAADQLKQTKISGDSK